MPTTTTAAAPARAALTRLEHDVLYAIGCGLTDAEIAIALAGPEHSVARQAGQILTALGLRNRADAIVHAFDCGLVTPGHGPRGRVAGTAFEPGLRICVLGPLRAWRSGQPVDLGPVRQQAVLAVLALRPDRAVSRDELLDGLWGTEPPTGNVVPVYIYRLRKILRIGDGADSLPARDRCGYRLASSAVDVDLARMEGFVTEAGEAERAGDLVEAVRSCSRALDLFGGEPLAGLPGPFVELERLRLAARRITLARRKAGWQLRLGRTTETITELFALAAAEPLDEPIAVLLMRALHHSGRRAEALAVFDRTRRRLRDELGVLPNDLLRRERHAMLRGDESPGRDLPGR
ncbi:BTAD domain-containing putative transcriptional regulator [Kitasatospora acidiphila]|uniref:BTAD domain-containing putative transcriptional regulator n=1 Tax=Kitasatospora acidiphila TaxID=2567942 RepID=UPI003C781448